MRILVVWYGLVILWITRHVKSVARRAGERLKSLGRKLKVWGEDHTPSWGRKLFHKCYLAEAEIHLDGKVFCGKIDAIYQEFSGKDGVLVISLKSVERRQSTSLVREQIGDKKFKLTGYGVPVVIQEFDWDCIWTGCDNGYVAIYFKQPTKKD